MKMPQRMDKLIEALKKEHQQIVAALNKVNELGIYSEKGKALLAESKGILVAHLNREDREFYPVLHRAALNNVALQRTLELFARDMDVISQAAIVFFDKYEAGGSGIDFARDFGRLYSTLQMRIGKEERILYAEYLKLQMA